MSRAQVGSNLGAFLTTAAEEPVAVLSQESAIDFVGMPLLAYLEHASEGDVDAEPVDMDELRNDIRCGYVSYDCSGERAEIQPKGPPKTRRKKGRIYRVEPPRLKTIVLLSASRARAIGIDVPGTPVAGASHPGFRMPVWAAPADVPPTYAPSATYTKGDWITHRKFGAGVVFGVEPGKVQVLFESGERVLVHAAQ